MTTVKKETKANEAAEDKAVKDAKAKDTKATDAKAAEDNQDVSPITAAKPDGEGAITDASEAHIKTVAPIAEEDKAETSKIDSVAVVKNTEVTQVQDLQHETELSDDIINKFAEREQGKFRQLLNSGQQGTADKYLHELAEEFVSDLAIEDKILVKADMVVKNYIRTV